MTEEELPIIKINNEATMQYVKDVCLRRAAFYHDKEKKALTGNVKRIWEEKMFENLFIVGLTDSDLKEWMKTR